MFMHNIIINRVRTQKNMVEQILMCFIKKLPRSNKLCSLEEIFCHNLMIIKSKRSNKEVSTIQLIR